MNKLATHIFLRTLLLAAALFIFQYAFSWGLIGHRTSAEIALTNIDKIINMPNQM